MVSSCLPWRKLLSPAERLRAASSGPASGGSSGRSEPSNEAAPLAAGRNRRSSDRLEGMARSRAAGGDKADWRRRSRTRRCSPGGTAVGLDGRTSKLRAFDSETFTGIAGLCNCSPRRTQEAPVPCPRSCCRRGAGVRGNGNCVHRSSDRLRPWLPRRSGSRYCG